MLQNLRNSNAPLDVAVEHESNQIEVLFRHDVGHAQVVVHDFVDAVERVLLVYNGIEEDAEGPNILLFAAICFASEDFGSSVI